MTRPQGELHTYEGKLAQIDALVKRAIQTYGTERELVTMISTIVMIEGIIYGLVTYHPKSNSVTDFMEKKPNV